MVPKTLVSLLFLTVIFSFTMLHYEQPRIIDADFKRAEIQYAAMLKTSTDLTQYPRSTGKDGSLHFRISTIGLVDSGLAHYGMSMNTRKRRMEKAAIKWTESLEKINSMRPIMI